jgi:hypothetical protein
MANNQPTLTAKKSAEIQKHNIKITETEIEKLYIQMDIFNISFSKTVQILLSKLFMQTFYLSIIALFLKL